jgi:hypothetical protein
MTPWFGYFASNEEDKLPTVSKPVGPLSVQFAAYVEGEQVTPLLPFSLAFRQRHNAAFHLSSRSPAIERSTATSSRAGAARVTTLPDRCCFMPSSIIAAAGRCNAVINHALLIYFMRHCVLEHVAMSHDNKIFSRV